jgi:hypothetical protein
MAGVNKPEKKKEKESWGLVQMDKATKNYYKRIKDNPRLWKNDYNK